MTGTRRNTFGARAWAMASLACALGAGSVLAQDAPAGPVPAYAQSIIDGKTPPADKNVVQAGCCGNISPAPMITGGCGGGAGDCPPGCPIGHCLPGRKCPKRYAGCSSCGGGGGCSSCATEMGPNDDSGCFSRLCNNLFSCICCPDPCYEPEWLPQANSAFFVDHARPQSHMRLRYEAGINTIMPDRNEFFWAKADSRGPKRERAFNYHDTTLYVETGSGAFSAFVDGPFYRIIESDVNGFDAGWGDMSLGTKSMFIDCELMQMTFQFKTTIPIGPAKKGFGIGHVALEPSLLTAVKLTPKTYFEGQLSEWIPIGGDDTFAGLVLHYHTAINHLWCQKKAIQFVTSWEYFGIVFQDGAYTNPIDFVGPATGKSSREAYHYMGPSCRFTVCDNYDVGFGAAFALTDDHFADQVYRAEFRIRY